MLSLWDVEGWRGSSGKMSIQVSKASAAGTSYVHSIVKCHTKTLPVSKALSASLKKKRPVIKLGSLFLAKSWVLEHSNNRKRLVIETLPGTRTGSTRLPSYLQQRLHFLWRLMELGYNGWARKPCSCFPRLSCNPGRGVGRRWGPWSSCSSGLIKGFPGLLPLFFRGWRHCRPHPSTFFLPWRLCWLKSLTNLS